MLYGDTKDGGFNMINIWDFFLAIKISCIHRYINKINDHWPDLIDINLGINQENQLEIVKIGSEHPKTNKIIEAKIPGISMFFMP